MYVEHSYHLLDVGILAETERALRTISDDADSKEPFQISQITKLVLPCKLLCERCKVFAMLCLVQNNDVVDKEQDHKLVVGEQAFNSRRCTKS